MSRLSLEFLYQIVETPVDQRRVLNLVMKGFDASGLFSGNDISPSNSARFIILMNE